MNLKKKNRIMQCSMASLQVIQLFIGSPFLRFQAAVPPFFNAPVALCALWRYVFCSACLFTQHRTKVQYLQDL